MLLSKQLDIIIFDAVRGGPIAKLPACDVFPLESVYAYVEVKSSILSSTNMSKPADNSIEKCLKDNATIRKMRHRRFFEPSKKSPVEAVPINNPEYMPIRGYVFSFEAKGAVAKNPAKLASRIKHVSRKTSSITHIHGLFILDVGYFETIPVNSIRSKDLQNVRYSTKNPLTAFKWQLLHSLCRFPRPPKNWTMDLERYNKERISWKNAK